MVASMQKSSFQAPSILDELRALKNPERALRDQAYHKSTREHWGIPVPESDRIARRVKKELSAAEILQTAQSLWETNLFDPMICAAKLLSTAKLKPSLVLWDTVVGFLKQVDGWALEDCLAHVAGKCILADESLLNELDVWTQHPNFWMRRAALVYTLPFAKPNRNPERMLQWASKYSPDPEWFIQKAIGWWLRDLSEHNPERVVLFLIAHWDNLKSVAKKESMRKLNPSLQKQILNHSCG